MPEISLDESDCVYMDVPKIEDVLEKPVTYAEHKRFASALKEIDNKNLPGLYELMIEVHVRLYIKCSKDFPKRKNPYEKEG